MDICFNLLGIYLEIELGLYLGAESYRICLTFCGTGKVAAICYISTAVYEVSYFSTFTCYCLFIIAILVGVKCHLVILICTSLVAYDVDHLFMCISYSYYFGEKSLI